MTSRFSLATLGPLAVVAILGYLAGYHRPPTSTGAAFAPRARAVSVAGARLEYPSSWRPLATSVGVPGLPMSGRLTLAPVGEPTDAGLIAGELPAGESSVLPRSFLSLLGSTPRTEVLDVLGGQAYGYSGIRLRGYGRMLELFVFPNLGGAGPTALACYASAAAASSLRDCARIVSRVSLGGQPQYDLTPDAGYARLLAATVGGLQRERLALRRRLAHSLSARARSALCTSLAASFARAARSLKDGEAPTVASSAATALITAALAARDVYRQLARAMASRSAREEALAMGRVRQAESALDGALQGFALLGYRRS